MPKCILDYCHNYAGMRRNVGNVMLHGFPTTVERIKIWLRSIEQGGQVFEDLDEMAERIFEGKKNDSYRVCSEHFSKQSYMLCGQKKLLRKDSVPTVFTKEGGTAPRVIEQRVRPRRAPLSRRAKENRKRWSTGNPRLSSPERIHGEKSRGVNDEDEMTQIILNLTLEIINLLTGEDYVVVKKTSGERVTPSCCPRVSGGWSRTLSPITLPPPHSLMHERNNEQKILELTKKITQLLTGEVPIRCEDVTVYFSMEEWEYLEGHKDLYKDIMMEDHQPRTSMGAFQNRNTRISCSTSDYQQPKCFKMCNLRNRLKKSALDSYEEGRLTDTNIYTPTDHTQYPSTHIKEEPVSSEGGNLRGTDIYTATDHTPYISTHIKEEPVSCERGNLRGTDIYTPTDHTQYPSTHIKEEPVSSEGGNLRGTDIYTATDHTPYISTHIKEEPVSCERGNLRGTDIYTPTYGGNLRGTDIYTPTDHTQYPSTHIKEEPVSCDEEDLRDTNTYTPTDHTQYPSTPIKEEPVSCGGGILTYLATSFKCSECSESFSSKTDLIYHQSIHRRERLKCSECEKYFSNKSNLSNHLRGHTGEKPHSCSTCGKGFTRRSTLVIHQRIHTGEKPFVCLECGRCFHGKGNLVKHAKVHRANKPLTIKTLFPLPLTLIVDSNMAPFQML